MSQTLKKFCHTRCGEAATTCCVLTSLFIILLLAILSFVGLMVTIAYDQDCQGYDYYYNNKANNNMIQNISADSDDSESTNNNIVDERDYLYCGGGYYCSYYRCNSKKHSLDYADALVINNTGTSAKVLFEIADGIVIVADLYPYQELNNSKYCGDPEPFSYAADELQKGRIIKVSFLDPKKYLIVSAYYNRVFTSDLTCFIYYDNGDVILYSVFGTVFAVTMLILLVVFVAAGACNN